jgi:Fe-S-cluster containining protein
LLESASFVYALVELLAEKGLLDISELEARKKAVAARLLDAFLQKGMGVAMQEGEQDKYAFGGSVDIDCDSRVHLCKASCCRMSFALSEQDVQEGVIKWDMGRPYLIAQDSEGYCRHLDRDSYHCMVREWRPLPCRGYDCRNDQRIWLDFDQKIINPELEQLFQQSESRSEGAS